MFLLTISGLLSAALMLRAIIIIETESVFWGYIQMLFGFFSLCLTIILTNVI